MSLVFLGGTVGNNDWRKRLLADLEGSVDLSNVFNPVVDDWNEAAQEAEERAKAEATTFVFYLASPQQEGNPVSAFSQVEATMALYDHPSSTVVVFDNEGLEGHSLKAAKQAENILRRRFPEAAILSGYDALLDWVEDNV